MTLKYTALRMHQACRVCIRISHFMLGQNVILLQYISIFHDFSMTFDILKDFRNFSRPGNQSFKFHDFSRFSMIVQTLLHATQEVAT